MRKEAPFGAPLNSHPDSTTTQSREQTTAGAYLTVDQERVEEIRLRVVASNRLAVASLLGELSESVAAAGIAGLTDAALLHLRALVVGEEVAA